MLANKLPEIKVTAARVCPEFNMLALTRSIIDLQ
ncbi:protein of unknown function [Methylocella tundrae]|uniref:Uncharacterized protein n=1 Tax=Methylocella tundrae TaxID=227605 RepID=A0A4U8Z5N5_METTU|nr:protein of unknown function [Methylocella tundrae]